VLRGGSWYLGRFVARCAARNWCGPNDSKRGPRVSLRLPHLFVLIAGLLVAGFCRAGWFEDL
jgi:hypothetical protein